MIGASGVGKTAFFLYPNLEYACASGMSFFASDTKGDLARNYGAIARDCYGYQVAVVDLRNPTRSDGYNLLTLIVSVPSEGLFRSQAPGYQESVIPANAKDKFNGQVVKISSSSTNR